MKEMKPRGFFKKIKDEGVIAYFIILIVAILFNLIIIILTMIEMVYIQKLSGFFWALGIVAEFFFCTTYLVYLLIKETIRIDEMD